MHTDCEHEDCPTFLLEVGEDAHCACSDVVFCSKTHCSFLVAASYLLVVTLSGLLYYIVTCDISKSVVLIAKY